jgi:hypothetical protein
MTVHPWSGGVARIGGALVLAFVVPACTAAGAHTARGPLSAWRMPATVDRVAAPDPANPHVRVPRVQYRSTMRAYHARRPVDALPWRAPAESGTSHSH